jgi:TP901 family phage tail tape measure protein
MNIGTLVVTLGADTAGLEKAATSLNSTAQKFRTFGYLASMALTTPMVMAGKAAFNMAKDFEFSMQKIVGLTGVAQNAVNKWSDEILKMGPEVAKGPKELAEALYFISSSGIKGAEAMNVLKLSAKAATAGLGSTQNVADLLTSALNAYRGTGLTATYATDVLVAAVREGKAEAEGFSSAMGQIIPIASQLGVSFDQVAGGMAAITLTGSSAANASVYLKGIFNSLLKATTEGEKALNSVGTSYGQLRNILANQGLIPLMQKLRDIQTKYGDEILSDVLPNIRALTGYLSIAGKNFQYNTELMKRVTNATGSLGQAFVAVADTIKVKYDIAIAAAQVSLISLGKSIAESFLPLLDKLVKKLGELTNWFNNLSAAQKQNKLEWVAFIAILGPASLLISLVMYSLKGLWEAGNLVFGILSKVRLVILANPYLAATAAIGLVVGGLVHYANNVKEVAAAHDSFNTSLVMVNNSLKKLKDLTPADYGNMTMNEIAKAQRIVYAEWMKADKLLKQGQTNKEGYSWFDKLFGANKNNDKFIQTQIDKINQLKAIYEGLGDAYYDVWQKSLIEKEIKKTETQINNYKKLQEGIKKAHKFVIDSYLDQLAKGNELLDLQDRIRELQSKEPIDYRKFFLKTGFSGGTTGQFADPTTILENWNARGLINEREFLDSKFEMDIKAAGENADAKMKIETQYYKDIQSLRRSDLQSYLNSASNAISSISSLIEASKQKELSAVGSNAKEREKIEKKYLEKQKMWAIAQALINGAVAVTNMIANVPLSVLNPATWVGIGVAAASTAAQVAIIAGQKMKTGGVVPSGYPNDSYPAMLTSGETVLPKALSGAIYQNDSSPREVLIKFQNGSLEGYMNYQKRRVGSYS